jgi:uncharacterized protein (DUF983 family)
MQKKARRRPFISRADAGDRYDSWEAVLAEGTWICCGRCGQRQFHKGDVTKKACRKCGARLADVGI